MPSETVPGRHRPPLVIDAHVHIGPFRNFHIPDNGIEGVVAAMDSLGVDVSVMSAHASISADYTIGNDIVIDAAARFPGRILGYCAVNPNYADSMADELERCFEHTAFRGIKLHPELHGNHALDSRQYSAVWEFASRRRLPVLSHSFFAGDGLDVFARIAESYPDVQLILGHAGQDFGIDSVIDLAAGYENIWLDLCGPLSLDGAVEKLAHALGPDRILFGSDLPFCDGALQLGTLLYSRLDPSQVEAIAGKNALGLFGEAAA
jgi:predicted TIM-barrel fold metal-dependent hydrolase